ncbi:hypothetical protein M5689_021645 [Euphorbia peplus]|nr:hypothetical protein M5689_021645 [Euphorbia peplus]
MSLMAMMLRPSMRMVIMLVSQPIASLTTLLYYSNLLPRNLNLNRYIRREYVDEDNLLFNFLVIFLRCLW